jgi:uncharacterized membrane protein YraQ (UPF0718 family)
VKNIGIFAVSCFVLTFVSLLLNKEKTILGLQKGLTMFMNIAVPFLNILILVSVMLYAVPSALIVKYLGAGSGPAGLALAAIVGSLTLIPGFISYPIAGTLIKQGASYATVATFMTTLMMVGIVTLPLEIRYFGKRVAVMRNALNFIAAVIIGLIVGIIV